MIMCRCDRNKQRAVCKIARHENHIDLFQSFFIICMSEQQFATSFDRCTSVPIHEHHESRFDEHSCPCPWAHVFCVCNGMHTFVRRELACVEYLMRFRCIIYLSHGIMHVFVSALASQTFLIRNSTGKSDDDSVTTKDKSAQICGSSEQQFRTPTVKQKWQTKTILQINRMWTLNRERKLYDNSFNGNSSCNSQINVLL